MPTNGSVPSSSGSVPSSPTGSEDHSTFRSVGSFQKDRQSNQPPPSRMGTEASHNKGRTTIDLNSNGTGLNSQNQ
jgi:hypothetical protein